MVLDPGEVVVVEVDGVVCAPVFPGVVVVTPGCVVVVLGDVGLVVCVLGLVVCPMPVLGVAVPVVCAEATPTANANTADANKIFRIEHAPCPELLRMNCYRARYAFCYMMRWAPWKMA